MVKRSDPNPAYWDDYTPFQRVKHDLIRSYLNGWYPKLGFWARRVLYVDTHAGRGKYESGDPGSPLIALQTLLNHSARESLLSKSEFNFLFIERDRANLASLQQEISTLSPLSRRINIQTSEGDAFEKLSDILKVLRQQGAQMAPAFLFVDPFGFKVPARLLADLLSAGRVELFVNVMWRELDMLIRQAPIAGSGPAQTLDDVFGSNLWRTEINASTTDERIEEAIKVLGLSLKARWVTPVVRMVTGGTATRYVLVHFSNSDHGRDLMKACRWSLFPDGDFRVRKASYGIPSLFDSEADLRPLRQWVLGKLAAKPTRWKDLHLAVRSEDWLEKQVNEVLKELKQEGLVDCDQVAGKTMARSFTVAANPVLRLKNR